MEKRSEAKTGWMQQRREQRRLKRELTGDSPERRAEHHEPKRDWVDRMLWSGGIQRKSRF